MLAHASYSPFTALDRGKVDRVKLQELLTAPGNGWVPPVAVETQRKPVPGRWLMMAMTSTPRTW
ncbi:MAG: hypothetical protein GY781_15500 [Gammaproteobacteria bacterium]|nr:hypothetical protein [Gammaproteobacteria bacterium]